MNEVWTGSTIFKSPIAATSGRDGSVIFFLPRDGEDDDEEDGTAMSIAAADVPKLAEWLNKVVAAKEKEPRK